MAVSNHKSSFDMSSIEGGVAVANGSVEPATTANDDADGQASLTGMDVVGMLMFGGEPIPPPSMLAAAATTTTATTTVAFRPRSRTDSTLSGDHQPQPPHAPSTTDGGWGGAAGARSRSQSDSTKSHPSSTGAGGGGASAGVSRPRARSDSTFSLGGDMSLPSISSLMGGAYMGGGGASVTSELDEATAAAAALAASALTTFTGLVDDVTAAAAAIDLPPSPPYTGGSHGGDGVGGYYEEGDQHFLEFGLLGGPPPPMMDDEVGGGQEYVDEEGHDHHQNHADDYGGSAFVYSAGTDMDPTPTVGVDATPSSSKPREGTTPGADGGEEKCSTTPVAGGSSIAITSIDLTAVTPSTAKAASTLQRLREEEVTTTTTTKEGQSMQPQQPLQQQEAMMPPPSQPQSTTTTTATDTGTAGTMGMDDEMQSMIASAVAAAVAELPTALGEVDGGGAGGSSAGVLTCPTTTVVDSVSEAALACGRGGSGNGSTVETGTVLSGGGECGLTERKVEGAPVVATASGGSTAVVETATATECPPPPDAATGAGTVATPSPSGPASASAYATTASVSTSFITSVVVSHEGILAALEVAHTETKLRKSREEEEENARRLLSTTAASRAVSSNSLLAAAPAVAAASPMVVTTTVSSSSAGAPQPASGTSSRKRRRSSGGDPNGSSSSNTGGKDKADLKWEEMYRCLQRYIENEKSKETEWDGNVPTNYKTEDGKGLGRWVNNQRSAKSRGSLRKDREERLIVTGLKWSVLTTNAWSDMLQELKLYIDEQRKDGKPWDGNVPTAYRIKSNLAADGSEIDEEKNLGRWVNRQRSLYQAGRLRKDREKTLEEVGLKWSVISSTTWDEMFDCLCKYKQIRMQEDAAGKWDGHVPSNYKTPDKSPKNLGRWVHRQRCAYAKKKMKEEYIAKLEGIGFSWTAPEKKLIPPNIVLSAPS